MDELVCSYTTAACMSLHGHVLNKDLCGPAHTCRAACMQVCEHADLARADYIGAVNTSVLRRCLTFETRRSTHGWRHLLPRSVALEQSGTVEERCGRRLKFEVVATICLQCTTTAIHCSERSSVSTAALVNWKANTALPS
eukprot:362989-Chlamydomonas_euryale.AAC.5